MSHEAFYIEPDTYSKKSDIDGQVGLNYGNYAGRNLSVTLVTMFVSYYVCH